MIGDLHYAMEVLRPRVLDVGGVWFNDGEFNLNMIAERNREARPGLFDDLVWLVYMEGGEWKAEAWKATADPGLIALKAPSNKNRVARIKAGQYRGAWTIGKHKQRYPALRQARKVTAERHAPGNNWQENPPTEDGLFGLNWHAAATDPFDFGSTAAKDEVNRWSEGCVVIQRSYDYVEFWSRILRAAHQWGPDFTGTVLDPV